MQVPEIGFGTWKYTGGVEPLRAGIEHFAGACLIDTLPEIWRYPPKRWLAKQFVVGVTQAFLATKVAPQNFRYRDLIAAAEQSLRRLGTDYIDLYQLHWPNYTVPVEDAMAAMDALVDAGKVRFIGVSNFSIQELKQAQAALSKHKIVSNQVRYSLIERTVESGLLEYCQQNQITLIAYSPFGESFQRMKHFDSESALAQAAKASGKTAAQVALNWLVAKDGRTMLIAIPKASTTAHVVENL